MKTLSPRIKTQPKAKRFSCPKRDYVREKKQKQRISPLVSLAQVERTPPKVYDPFPPPPEDPIGG